MPATNGPPASTSGEGDGAESGGTPTMLGQDCPHFLDNIHQKVRLQLASLAPAPLSPSTFSTEVPLVNLSRLSLCFYGTGRLFWWVGYFYRHLPGALVGSTIFLIGFALVHFICVITLVVWLSHSIYVCVLVSCFVIQSPLRLGPEIGVCYCLLIPLLLL